MPRLFTGIEVPPDIGLLLSLKRGGLPGARWIDAESYHITLRFIGDVDNPTAGDLEEGLEHLSDSLAFSVSLTALGAFGGDKPRALFAAVETTDRLQRLQAAHERIIQRVGIEPEGRKYVPHVTLARLDATSAPDLARFLGEAPPFQVLAFPVERFVLFSSRAGIGGGPYVVERSFPLAR